METAVAPRRNMLTGIARYIQEHEPWSIYLKPVEQEAPLGSWLQDWDGDGVIVSASGPDRNEIVHTHLCIVDVFGEIRADDVPLVHSNDLAVGRLGAEHLMERGFKYFGFCEYVGPSTHWSRMRREGFERTLAERGLTCRVHQTEFPKYGTGGPKSWERQQEQLAKWLANFPAPVGVMTSTDLLGQQLLEACQRAAIHVPEQVAVIGVDNDEIICRIAVPPLSSVILNDHQRGYTAAAILDQMMAGKKPPANTVWIEPVGVVTRASTDIMAVDDIAVARALRFIRERAYQNISVDDVAAAVPVSRTALQQRFRKLVGRSIHEEILRLRINRAVELLNDTTLELKVISRKVGLNSPAYMSAVFRNRLGRTPGSYRQNLRLKSINK